VGIPHYAPSPPSYSKLFTYTYPFVVGRCRAFGSGKARHPPARPAPRSMPVAVHRYMRRRTTSRTANRPIMPRFPSTRCWCRPHGNVGAAGQPNTCTTRHWAPTTLRRTTIRWQRTDPAGCGSRALCLLDSITTPAGHRRGRPPGRVMQTGTAMPPRQPLCFSRLQRAALRWQHRLASSAAPRQPRHRRHRALLTLCRR
jgi:hypothetical protein